MLKVVVESAKAIPKKTLGNPDPIVAVFFKGQFTLLSLFSSFCVATDNNNNNKTLCSHFISSVFLFFFLWPKWTKTRLESKSPFEISYILLVCTLCKCIHLDTIVFYMMSLRYSSGFPYKETKALEKCPFSEYWICLLKSFVSLCVFWACSLHCSINKW